VAAEIRCQLKALGGLTGVTLDREDIEAIAQRLVQLVDHSADRAELVGVEQVARHLGVSGGWVYRNADRLGALRVGRRLRFDLAEVDRLLAAPPPREAPAATPAVLPEGVRLLRGRTLARRSS
jgi:excisionase family DNA binding protein